MSPAGQALKALLDAERSALLSGDLEALGPLLRRKEALMDALAARPTGSASLAALDTALARNARLFEAALAGLREGRARAETLRAAGAGFATYDRDGRTRSAPAATAMRHKA